MTFGEWLGSAIRDAGLRQSDVYKMWLQKVPQHDLSPTTFHRWFIPSHSYGPKANDLRLLLHLLRQPIPDILEKFYLWLTDVSDLDRTRL